MAKRLWEDHLALGIAELDAQHKELAAIIEELGKAMEAGRERDELAGIINRVNDYAQVHFATERKYMAPYAAEIPNYELHMQEHREFFSDAIGFLLDYLDRGTATTPDLLAYLESWWAKHVGGTDKVMGSILRSKGIA